LVSESSSHFPARADLLAYDLDVCCKVHAHNSLMRP
jgi:hypothetical protein